MLRRLLLTFFCIMLTSMIVICIFAAKQQNIIAFLEKNSSNLWFLATLLDCYWGLLIFYIWCFYKQPSWKWRMTSFICICTLGNIYVAIFAIFYIYKLPKDCTIDSILITQQTSQL